MEEFNFVTQMDVKTESLIGAPPYLNSRPLIYGIEKEVKLAVPSRLTDLFQKRQLQVVLAPIVEFFRNNRALLLPEIAIASNGPVESVRFFYKSKPHDVKKVALDSSSKTSEMLLRLILKEKYGVEPEFIQSSTKIDFLNSVYDGILVIGDTALEMLNQFPSFDLGKVWTEMTELPFVYACWMVDKDQDARKIFTKLSRAKERGLQHLGQIAEENDLLTADAAQRYLTENIKFDLGEQEIKGIETFQTLLAQAGLLETERELHFANI